MRQLFVLGAMALAPLTAAASCGSAFCTINTSWDAHGAWLEPGWSLDLRYEWIRQDQPRHGMSDVGVGAIPQPATTIVVTAIVTLLIGVPLELKSRAKMSGLAPWLEVHVMMKSPASSTSMAGRCTWMART